MKRYNGTTWESTGAQLHLTGNDITNDSDVTGTKVKDALNTLDGQTALLRDEDYQLAMDGFICPTFNNLKNYWDDANKLYHRVIARVDMGSLNWGYAGGIFYVENSDCPPNLKIQARMHSLDYTYTSKQYQELNNMEMSSNYGNWGSQRPLILIKNTSYSDATAFKTAMSGKFIYYELSTPQILNNDANGLQTTNIFGTSDAWANNASYTAGNYRIYSNALYRCILNHSTSTSTTILPTNAAYWKKVSLSELSTQKMGMPDYNNPILNLGINDITTSTVSWTATENCIVYFTLFPTNPRNIYVSINNVTMYYGGYIYNTDASAQIGKCFFSHNVILRTGDTVKFDNIDASGARSNSIRAYKCI